MQPRIIKVQLEHIELGILKYGGVVDVHLQTLIKAAGLEYIPYVFKDGRILLVLPNNMGAFLYSNKENLFSVLKLE